MSATLIQAGAVVTLDEGDTIYQPGYLVVEDERLVEIGPQSALGTRRFDHTIDLNKRLVMPGLINAHTHSPMVLFRGLAEGHSLFSFEGWYNAIRVVEAVLTPELIPAAVRVSCAEMIRTGTTCFADQYFFMEQIVPAVRQSGMRAALAYGIVEIGDPVAREREIAATTSFLESVQGDPRIKGWVGPHAFFVDNSPEAIQLELALADRFKTGLHIHLATSGEEDRYCQEHYGHSAVQQMKELGILDRPVLAAHCITVPLEDFSTLAAHPFTAVIAPSSSMRSAVDPAPLKAMREAGINTALGTDNVTGNNSYDLFKEMQIAGKLMSMREHQPNAIPTRYILEMATSGGARALGLADEIGTLEAGKRADLIALDLTEIGWVPTGGQDLYTALVYSVCGLHVTDVMVDGNWLFRNRAWTTLDYAADCAELDAAYAELRRRLSAQGE
jgi:5-methylthioadenosine/S-adenosylhomocysteine deaminase